MRCAFFDLGKHLGGAENYLLTIVKNWNGKGNETILFTRKNSEFCKLAKEHLPDTQIEEVDFKFRDIKRAKRILRQKKVELINTNGINSGVFINMLHSSIPIVTTVHSNAELDRVDKAAIIRYIFVKLENYCLKRSDRIIVVSDALRELLIKRKIRESAIITIYNGVKKIDYVERQLRESEDEMLKICYVGRLEKVKGCEYLIQALSEIKSLSYKCDIFGNGSNRDILQTMVGELGIESRVFFKGFSNKIREILPEYDVLVMPSLFEAFPLTIPEAMNARTLIVCSNAGGLPCIIKDKVNGYLFESRNAVELAEVLEDIYYHPNKQVDVINEAYSEFESKYTEDIMLRKTFGVFCSIDIK